VADAGWRAYIGASAGAYERHVEIGMTFVKSGMRLKAGARKVRG